MRILVLSAVLLVFATIAIEKAAAQDAPLLGRWIVEAELADRGCRMDGAATVSPGEARDTRNIALSLIETCQDGRRWDTTQACVATIRAMRVAVVCELTSATANYTADNFALNRHSADLLQGVLNSRRQWTTRWTRQPESTK